MPGNTYGLVADGPGLVPEGYPPAKVSYGSRQAVSDTGLASPDGLAIDMVASRTRPSAVRAGEMSIVPARSAENTFLTAEPPLPLLGATAPVQNCRHWK